MRDRLFALAILFMPGCARPDATGPAVGVAEARVELAEMEVERCEGASNDAREDLKRLKPSSVPEGTLIEARRKVADAEFNLKVARAKLKEQKALADYARATGRLQ